MEAETDLNRELISIIYDGGKKDFKYMGYSSYREGDHYLHTHQITEVCFCEDRLKEVLKTGLAEWIEKNSRLCTQYQTDCTEEEAEKILNTYFNGESGTKISPKDISLKTQCGNYWFYTSELW